MTSKISSYSLRIENIKHRIGMILLTGFLFFIHAVRFLISAQNICGTFHEEADKLKAVTRLSEPGMPTGIFTMLVSVLLAISGLRYLHSKQKTDFYHSLPVKRKRHLHIIMTNDLLIFAVFLALLLCAQCVIASVSGYYTETFRSNTFLTFLCCLVVFAACYVTMALAMILTGQTFVGIIMFGMLTAYMPLIFRNLFPALASIFFKTYQTNAEWGTAFTYASPVSLAANLLIDQRTWTWEAHNTAFTAACIWIVVIGTLVFVLFDKRPSETAGKAIAFPKIRPILRMMLVIPASIYAGLYLYTATFSAVKGWIIAGIIIGGFLTHGIIECIYRFDIRGLLACKRQLLLSIAAALLLVGVFWRDVFGYDAYLPSKEETDSILIDGDYSYDGTFWGTERTGVTGTVKDSVLDILEDAVEENDKNYEESPGEDIRSKYTYFAIRYRLKNGREKQRSYVLDLELKDRLMQQVFDTEEYRKAHYSLYTGDWSTVTDVSLCHFTGYLDLRMLEREDYAGLFQAYLEDFSKFDYNTAKTTIPLARLSISCDTGESYSRNYPYEEVVSCGFGESYYIYPSFQKTIAYLEDHLPEKLPLSFEDITINRIDIWRFDEPGMEEEYIIEDEEFIQSISGNLFGADILEGRDTYYPIDATYNGVADITSEKEAEQINIYTDSDTLEKIKEFLQTHDS